MKIAIAGYGAEGQSNYNYFFQQGHELTIVDERELSAMDLPYGAVSILGEGAFHQLDGFDMVVRTAGLAPRKIQTDGKIWSATNEFFARCPAPIIGVTGSKGKGTTSSLIASILRAAGRTVHLVGNIGVPALDELHDIQPTDVVVYELSSFQLWDAERSPNIAVVLYIEPEHLDVHTDMKEYVTAKAQIAMHQAGSDIVVYNQSNDYATSIALRSSAAKIPYQNEQAAHVVDGYFWFGDIQLCSIDQLKLPGRHNYDNACAAITAVWKWVKQPEVIAKGLADFTGLPHRLKFIRSFDGVSYYDDSIATTPGSAIAAIHAFSQPKILILGGSSKGADFSELAQVASGGNVRSVVAIGDEAPKIVKAFKKSGIDIHNLGSDVTMVQVVQKAHDLAVDGDVVALSPSCASFGMFKNYVDRGQQFIQAVQEL
ncbi:MAG: UDP-N-acetylmuramoyl-L-alanine--D-glutamate ligase [Chloroflexi bacterium]|nr:MAG: UDP-N-acetylmuramoyl-L-alanine--D-glutamate ligase [Chloroflexota bacterium]